MDWFRVIDTVKEKTNKLEDRSKETTQHEAQVNEKMGYTEQEQRHRGWAKEDSYMLNWDTKRGETEWRRGHIWVFKS